MAAVSMSRILGRKIKKFGAFCILGYFGEAIAPLPPGYAYAYAPQFPKISPQIFCLFLSDSSEGARHRAMW